MKYLDVVRTGGTNSVVVNVPKKIRDLMKIEVGDYITVDIEKVQNGREGDRRADKETRPRDVGMEKADNRREDSDMQLQDKPFRIKLGGKN